jgi:ATP-dependent DNA ligase
LDRLLGKASAPIHRSPSTTDVAVGQDWFTRFEGAGLDGVIAKRLDGTYQPDKRALLKLKHARTADCVVAGFRWHKDGAGVGSLLLGLYDDVGTLHHLGVATSFSAARRAELVAELAPYRADGLVGHPWASWAAPADDSGRLPGAVSRWNADKKLDWEPLRIELVAEVAYDQLQRDRFRHATRLVRWRPDRDPSSCTYDQLERAAPAELHQVFGG